MKKEFTTVITLLVSCAMLFSLASCGEKKEQTDNSLMKGIYEKLIRSADYKSWKGGFNATEFEEKFDSKSIVIQAQGEEGVNGEYSFTRDGDYITYTPQSNEDYAGFTLFLSIKNAVADYYGMNRSLVSGYICGLDYFDMENKYFLQDFDHPPFKVYAAGKWDMKGIDNMYINDKALRYNTPLTEEPVVDYFISGKIEVKSYGNKDNLQLVVGEFGDKNTDLTYQSLMNVVAKLQPVGYKTFAKEYTELKDVKGKYYESFIGNPTEVLTGYTFAPEPGYRYVTVIFNAK